MIWFLLVLGLYPYAIYPAIALLISILAPRRIAKGAADYTVTVVISAYNEVDCINKTLVNKLEQNYPAEKLSVIVVSDESDDGTDEAVAKSCDATGRVKLLRQVPRAGKTSALNLALRHCNSDIIVFSDANSTYDNDVIKVLVKCFADPSVGYVTGRMIYTKKDGTESDDGSHAYMNFENKLRIVETRLGSIVGVNGGIDAVRRSLYEPMRANQLPDFVLPLNVVAKGARCIYEPRAILREQSLPDSWNELRMRIRAAQDHIHDGNGRSEIDKQKIGR